MIWILKSSGLETIFFLQKCLRMCFESIGNKENTDKKRRESNLTDS